MVKFLNLDCADCGANFNPNITSYFDRTPNGIVCRCYNCGSELQRKRDEEKRKQKEEKEKQMLENAQRVYDSLPEPPDSHHQ